MNAHYNIYRANVVRISPKTIEQTVDLIIKMVCERYDITQEQIEGKSRKGNIPFAKHMARLLMREKTPLSLLTVGSYTGMVDHSTVVHSENTARDLIQVSKIHRAIYNQINAAI